MKTRQLREVKLYQPMKQWFIDKGYEVRPEFPIHFRNFDAIAVKGEIVIAVEMKMTLSKKLYFQIKYGRLFADFSYGVISTRPKISSETFKWFVEKGIGILSIKNDNVVEIVKPIKVDLSILFENYHRKAINYVKQTKDIGVGGKPRLKGEGPAQDVDKLIEEYRSKNPKATWKELYKEIPNHYCSHQSMQTAMYMLQRWLRFN